MATWDFQGEDLYKWNSVVKGKGGEISKLLARLFLESEQVNSKLDKQTALLAVNEVTTSSLGVFCEFCESE